MFTTLSETLFMRQLNEQKPLRFLEIQLKIIL